jgi:hypothetical protein
VRPRSLVVALPVAASAVALLAGCVFSPGVNTAPTVPADDLATLAADELEKTVGLRPTIDCGEDDIPVKVNTSVTCLLVDPVGGLEFDVLISFTEVSTSASGIDYAIDIEVADVPNNPPQPTAEPGASVPITDIESLAISALSNVLDYVPEVHCDGDSVEIVVGNTVDCTYESPEGTVDAVVTITESDPTAGTYRIRVD